MPDALDHALINSVCAAGEGTFDPAWSLLRGPATYNPIHTRIVSGHAHRYLPSLAYALALYEQNTTDGRSRASAIVDRVVAGQDSGPASPTYGLWGYFAEEPVAEMVPPDWNQADFGGRLLALLLLRHRHRLGAQTRARAERALHHAARSIVRRDVSMYYTNIAAKGTFVTLTAAQLLADEELRHYATRRLARFAAAVARSGSFTEYNSPTYWLITVEALTGIDQYVVDDDVREQTSALLELAWTHLARRWHAPTGQLAGPMSRAYPVDTAAMPELLMFLRKALAGASPFGAVPVPAADPSLVLPAVLQPQVPERLRDHFLQPPAGEMYRELFVLRDAAAEAPEQAGGTAVEQIVGSTWREPRMALGTVNQADTWLQRRNLLGYWTAPGDAPWRQPARYVRLRVLKDGFDLAAGSFSAVQAGRSVLWGVSLAAPGGDRHLHLDTIDVGEPMRVSSVRVVFDVGGADEATCWVNGDPVEEAVRFEAGDVVEVAVPGAQLTFCFAAAFWGDMVAAGRITREDDVLRVGVDLVDEPATVEVFLDQVDRVFVGGAMTVTPRETRPGGAAPAETPLRPGQTPPGSEVRVSADPEMVTLVWRAPVVGDVGAADLVLRCRSRVGTRAQHAAALLSTVDGRSPVAQRLDQPVGAVRGPGR
ncbi:hypothetical protein [Phytoactinopolyspora limicola]|uniref:hypothetical protein n=1 Tax=Phytoactinopolyspora limicola TaxID=2715536 RepID=UPI001409081F|nr:hypothetical protein [Phytoactinopolyspora limicola]